MITIAILALTYKRNDGLQKLLEGIFAQELDNAKYSIFVVIVDNDPEEGARQIVESFQKNGKYDITYATENRRGISLARNTALGHAKNAEWICFIDDDEVPEKNWLAELIHAQKKHNADVVAGPVLVEVPSGQPAWMKRGKFLEHKRHEDGMEISQAGTGNVMFRASLLEELNLKFDEKLALTGGEDKLFFLKISLSGKKMVWADRAIAVETIPDSRANIKWILKRAYRFGSVQVYVENKLYEKNIYGNPFIRGLKRVVRGAAFLPFHWVRGKEFLVLELRHIYYGAGMIAGWFGKRHMEYNETHGS